MLMDFTELRNQVLAGEDDEVSDPIPSSMKMETLDNGVTLGSLINENSSENEETRESLENVPVEKTKWNVV